jgi:hypothetical protein
LFTDRADVVSVATPLPLSVTAGLTGDPSTKKVTVPPGVPPDPVTVAVNVTDWVNTDPPGALEVRVVVLPVAAGGVIVTVNVGESLEAMLVLPA